MLVGLPCLVEEGVVLYTCVASCLILEEEGVVDLSLVLVVIWGTLLSRVLKAARVAEVCRRWWWRC